MDLVSGSILFFNLSSGCSIFLLTSFPGPPKITFDTIRSVRLRNQPSSPSSATIAMATVGDVLDSVVANLSDENYAESLAFYHLWLDIGQAHLHISSDQTFNSIFNNRRTRSINPESGKLIHPSAHLILRFAGDVDVQSDSVPPPHTSGLQSRLCTTSLQEFFGSNLRVISGDRGYAGSFYADANLIAHWANLGYVDETTIRNHILQSLISHPTLDDHQADALVILFKLAGATFEAYADPSVVNRCFELLQDHKYSNPYRDNGWDDDKVNGYDLMRRGPLQVRTPTQ